MPSNSRNQYLPAMRRIKQISSMHCGPAVLAMLASFHGVRLYQREIVTATGVKHKLKTHGMTVTEMAQAAAILAPQLRFWYKDQATLPELDQVLSSHHHPVGVEWQGVFEELADDDDGHYSILTHIDLPQNQVLLSDPYGRWAKVDRQFQATFFEGRWWDTNEIIDPTTGMRKMVRDHHMMFILTPAQATFPQALAMKTI